jgi:hypothetical protein
MARDELIRIRRADLGSHPEAHILNAAFRPGVLVLKLRVEIDWEPTDPLAALVGIESRLVTQFPSLREHDCRGSEEYHILRSTNGKGWPVKELEESETTIEAALALAHLYEHVMIDTIAFMTDERVVSGATGALKDSRTEFDIFVESPDAVAARLAVGLATRWMSLLATGESPNGAGNATLALIRHLYRAQPETIVVDEVSVALRLSPGKVHEGLLWLESSGLTSRIPYSMNLSGFPYYALTSAEIVPLTSDPERSRIGR